MIDEFHPENYTDEIRQRTLEMIEQKVNGEDIVVSLESHGDSKVIDIMEALKASLKDNSASRAKPKRAPIQQSILLRRSSFSLHCLIFCSPEPS